MDANSRRSLLAFLVLAVIGLGFVLLSWHAESTQAPPASPAVVQQQAR